MERHIEMKFVGLQTASTLHYPAGYEEERAGKRFPVIVICHGFTGNRIGDNRLYVKAAREFANRGYFALRFDYVGSGESTGDYGASGMSALIAQTRYVLDYALDMESVDPSRVILLGHSLGAAIALLTATRDKRINCLALWSPVGHPFQDIVGITGREIYEEAVTKGSSEFLGYTLQHSFFESLSGYNPFQEARHFAGDVLLVHGTADAQITSDYSTLYQKVFWTRDTGLCDKEFIGQADHTYSTRGHAAAAIQITADWLDELKRKKDEWYGWSI